MVYAKKYAKNKTPKEREIRCCQSHLNGFSKITVMMLVARIGKTNRSKKTGI
jgi:hypothetical protein